MKSSAVLSRALPSVLGVLGAGTLLCGATAQAQQQVDLSQSLSLEIIDRQVEAAGPESDWNCLDIGIAETAFRAIQPNYRHGDPVYIALMKSLAKELWEESFFSQAGAIGTARDGGTIGGMEFAVFEGINPTPPPAVWDLTADLYGLDYGGVRTDLGTLYLYSSANYTKRLQQLSDYMDGATLAQYTVWRGPTFSSQATSASLRLQGDDNTLYGDAFGNDDVRLGGTAWVIRDTVYHVGLYLQFGTGHQIGAIAGAGAASALPAPKDVLASYQAQAAALKQSFTGDLTILNDGCGGAVSGTGQPLSGVVYTTGDIVVDGSGINASLTLVSCGSIDISGGDNILTAAVDDLLLWSASSDTASYVAIDSSTNILTGSMYSSAGELRISGSSNQMSGRFDGDRVKVTGGWNVFTDGTE